MALTSFLSCPRVPTAFTEAAYPGVPSTDLEPLKLWAQQLPAPSPEVVQITMSDVTLLGKSWMHQCNQMLRLVHPAIRAVRFRFPVAAVQDLCQQSSGKLIGTPHEFGTRVHDTKDLQHGWAADLGVSHVAPKKGLLEALPFGVGVVSGECWESLSACPIIPEWCRVVPDYTTPALYKTKESVFLRGAASPPPYISQVAPVFSHELPAHDLESDESLCNLGFRVVRGAVEAKECENRYRILVDSCGTAPDAIWDLLSNAHSRDPKLPRRWGTWPGKLISVLGKDPLQRAGQQCSARWPKMKDLFPTQWSAIAAGEDAREQTWHTDVDKLPGTLPSKGELPVHLSRMLALSDKYHSEVHLGSHLGNHDALRVETFEFQRGDLVLFASTLRHRGPAALPGVGKQVVLFRFLTPDERHKWVDVERFILDPLPGAKDELASQPRGDRPLPNPRALSHWGQYFAFGEGLQGAVGLPRFEQLDDWLAPVGPSGPGCPYHPLLLARPALEAADPMCHVYVEKGNVLWTSGPSWLHLRNSGPGEAALLQQYWAPSSRPISAQQALLLGFSWHRGPEKRCTRSDAGAEVPLLMRCICSGKVFLPSPPALQDSHRGVGGILEGGATAWWWGAPGSLERWVRGCGPVGLWAGRGFFVCHACNAPRVGLTSAQGAPRVRLTCAQGGQRVGLLHRPCQSAAGLCGACMGACMGPVWALCMACMGLC